MKGGIVGTYVRETGRDILDTERPIMLVPRTALAQLLQQRVRWLEFPDRSQCLWVRVVYALPRVFFSVALAAHLKQKIIGPSAFNSSYVAI